MSKEDNYNDEEYHFAVEPDSVDANAEEEEVIQSAEDSAKAKFAFKEYFDFAKIKKYLSENVPVRNLLIVATAIIFLIIIYNITKGMLTHKKSDISKNTSVSTPAKKNKQASQAPVTYQQPKDFSAATQQTKLESQNKLLQSKLSQLQQTQDTISSRVSNLGSDTFKLNTEYQEISEKLNKLAEQVEKLASSVEDQAHTIMIMSERQRRQPRANYAASPRRMTYMKYNVKAVIPGRAWLIGQNGSTLTVRKGSIIPGYGVVTLVDVAQGRVLTNSGRIITFAQTDS